MTTRRKQTFLARHIGFTPSGKPKWTPYIMPVCLDAGIPDALPINGGIRHVSFNSIGRPIWATALTCCRSVDHCRPRVETGCVPGGIDRHLTLYFADVENCPLGDNQREARLRYVSPTGPEGDPDDSCYIPLADPGPTIPGCTNCDDPTKGKWVGSVSLLGGTVNFEVCCFRTDVDGISRLFFHFLWWGTCNGVTEQGCIDVMADCEDPISVDFGQIDLPNCCACTHSDQTATVGITMRGNCYGNVIARHVGFMPNGGPIWAEENCKGDHGPYSCGPACGLKAIISGCRVGVDGTYDLTYESGGPSWNWDGPDPAIHVTCFCNEDGTATITVTVVCGATNTGTGSMTVLLCDLEDLDVIVPVVMTDPSAGSCTGICRFIWNSMTGWGFLDSTCTEDCDPCGETPIDSSPGSVDGEIRTQPCSGGSTGPTCCIGTIPVRIMR